MLISVLLEAGIEVLANDVIVKIHPRFYSMRVTTYGRSLYHSAACPRRTGLVSWSSRIQVCPRSDAETLMRDQTPTTLLLALIVLLSASSVSGQQLHTAGRGVQSLESACDGAWLRIESAVSSLSHMPKDALDRAERERVTCLLASIDKTTFDADPQMNDVYARVAVSTLVGVYGPEGYDFFASELANQSPEVQRALDAALFGRGHPDAFRRYFQMRRSNVAREERRSIAATPAVWAAVIERGTCSEELCSSRIGETLQIVRQNLDVIDGDLVAAESFSPSSATPDAAEQAARTRSSARRLRDIIGRVRRGEVVLGSPAQ